PLNYQKWRNVPAFTIDTSNSCRLFPIPWLNCLSSTTSICTGYNPYWTNHTHYRPGLVEVVKFAVQNTALCPHIFH
ncbi:uncharacterized protein K444DRAFT_705183, partial [Hyaloscypha bicolor E]